VSHTYINAHNLGLAHYVTASNSVKAVLESALGNP